MDSTRSVELFMTDIYLCNSDRFIRFCVNCYRLVVSVAPDFQDCRVAEIQDQDIKV